MKHKGPVSKMKEDLLEKTTELKQTKDKYLRSVADMDNYRKRMDKEMDEHKKYSKVDFFLKIIPVLENFDRALCGAEMNEDFESFRKGLEIIDRQFKETLKSLGLKEFSGLGETFDPAKHEAIAVVTVNDKPENTIVEEISKGYVVGDRVIKPAKVMVSKQVEGGQENAENNRD
ncbi:MAG TPA: nucleotide exchange factor GrpE [bacterium]